MPRNNSGVYTLPEAAFVPGTTISSTAVNTDFLDIAAALTDSVAADGQTTMTGPLLTSTGSAAAPSITFGTNQTQGLFNNGAGSVGISVGGTLVAQATSSGLTNAAGTPYITANPPILNNYMSGYTLSNDVSNANTVLDIDVGMCTDSTNASFIKLTSAISKSTGSLWTAGSGSFGMGTGLAIAASTWYHVFAITNTNATWNTANTDIYFDNDPTGANAPAGTTVFRRIGSFRTDASKNILAFSQFGNEFLWGNSWSDAVNASCGTSSRTLFTLTVPTGVKVYALFNPENSSNSILFTSPDQADQPPTVGTQGTNNGNGGFQLYGTGSTAQAGALKIRTNTSAQVGARVTSNAGVWIITYGWEDLRGFI